MAVEMLMRGVMTVVGLLAFLALSCTAFRLDREGDADLGPASAEGQRIRLIAVGDINLGRTVGQILLRGDTLYPFDAVRDTLRTYDVVFGNLESVLSDQRGETESRYNNIVFTGPPSGARALSLAGITVVSIANNHALDYGRKAFDECRQLLEANGVAYAGGYDSAGTIVPAVLERAGMSIAVFAVTDIMNGTDERWRNVVVPADTGTIFPALRRWKPRVDMIVLSYHGGSEYQDRPSSRVRRFMVDAVASGAKLVLGHHPHVPYGLERVDGSYVVHSLGNFVFRQPSRFWTQRGMAFAADVVKDSSGVHIVEARCLPLVADFQPRFVRPGDPDADTTLVRIARLSSGEVKEQN